MIAPSRGLGVSPAKLYASSGVRPVSTAAPQESSAASNDSPPEAASARLEVLSSGFANIEVEYRAPYTANLFDNLVV